MTLALLAVAVFAFVLVAWTAEFRHKEESLPSLGNRRHVAPFVAVAVATLVMIPVVLRPLVSVAEWPRSTQVAWTAVEAKTIALGGAEHSAVIGWPNGTFWPEVSVERTADGFRLRTRGGAALIRVDGSYANGEVIALGGGAKQIGRFAIELRDGWFGDTLVIARTPVAEPLVVMKPPKAHPTRARSFQAILVPHLNDLRRRGDLDLASVQQLEAWAGSLGVLMPTSSELRVVADGEPWREIAAASAATVEILWPRRRLVMRLTESEGIPRLTFASPWTRTTSLPPFEKGETTLQFAREASAGANTFLLPLGHGASDFRYDAILQLSQGNLPRFRDGRDLAPPPPPGRPRWLERVGEVAPALEANRSLSSLLVALRGMSLTITILRDLPTPRALLLSLAVAWLAFAAFVGAIAFGRAHRLRLRDFWCFGGVLVAIWAILLFRVLLAVRYLLTPTAVDEVTVKGLSATLAALVIVPGFIALAVQLWLHHRPGSDADPRSRAMTIGVALLLVGASIVEFVIMPRQVLPNLGSVFLPSALDRLLLVVYAVAALAIAGAFGLAQLVWQLPYRVTFENGRAFWQTLSSGGPANPFMRVINALGAPAMKRHVIVWLVGALVILLFSKVVPEYVRQIIAPLWMIGIPALLILARPSAEAEDAFRVLDRGAEERTVEPSLVDTFAAVVILVFAPTVIMLWALSDFGAIYSVLAFWFPLALLLLLTSARRLATTLLVVLTGGIVFARLLLLGTYALAPGMTEHILSRVEVMKYGASAQEWLLELEAPSAGDAKAVTASNVRNALVHEWEHMAMVRKAGWEGLGFNRAPASQSFIRQDTIQYDSVYSFFVVGEHGIAGGLALLAIFAVPVILLLMRRTRLRQGDMFALALAAAFLGEAVAHAAMNVAQLWFSGRNLPLLATASNSDVLRWAILLGAMVQALFWSFGLRSDAFETIADTAVTRTSIFDPAFAQRRRRLAVRGVIAAVVVAGLLFSYFTRDFAWLAFALTIPVAMTFHKREYPALALLPALLVVILVVRGSIRAVRSDEFDVLTWSRLLKRVDELHDDGTLRFDVKRRSILYCSAGECTDRPTGATLLEAEILRFNSLPAELRMDGGREALPRGFFAGLSDPAAYYSRMYDLWQHETARMDRVRPSVFAVRRVIEEVEGTVEERYEVTGNPDFNVMHSFVDARGEKEMQPISIRGRNGEVELLGRAWAMGRWVYAPTQQARSLGLGWMRELGDALVRVREARRRRIGELTLDADLQRVTQTAAENAGRELFSGLLASGAPAPLPPRVAMTIMRGTTGEVLAMGSWPRASSGDRWSARREVSAGARTWIERDPPFSWLGSRAPRELASRHAVDHNLAAIEMGSAAKPFWATSALVVHPQLHRQLWTRNADCDRVVERRCYERKVFGAEIGRGWQVSPSPRRWIDFDTYLAASDNRYHTRLGLLAVARSTAETVADDGRGPTGSDRESITARPVPWNRYPALPDSMSHTRDKPQRIEKLHEQRVAAAMRDLFGLRVGAAPAEGPTRRHQVSFWSGDEHDDLQRSEALQPLAVVSPEAADLRLHRITNTRDYVTVLLGGGSGRWSNVAAASAFSTWAVRQPVVAHVTRSETRPLPSRAAAFSNEAVAAAEKLRTGLRRVIDDGTAVRIRRRLEPLRGQYEVYAKTGTLATVDPDRPTSRILLVIVGRDEQGRVKNALTLSFVAERASMGFATEEVGLFVQNYMAELLRLLEG